MHSEELVAVEDVLEPVYHSVDCLGDSFNMLVYDLHFFGHWVAAHGLTGYCGWLIRVRLICRRWPCVIRISHSPNSYYKSWRDWQPNWPNTQVMKTRRSCRTIWIRQRMIPRNANINYSRNRSIIIWNRGRDGSHSIRSREQGITNSGTKRIIT